MDQPDLVPDEEALECRRAITGMIASKSWYLWFFSFILGRQLTVEETTEVWLKVTGYRPVPYEQTWAAACERIEQHRRENPEVNFWRSQV